MKNNPLFFDSTKFRGDNVIVDIELKGVELKDSESLFCTVSKIDGSKSRTPMRAEGLKKWKTEARVEYQTKIKLDFEIELEGTVVIKSDTRSCIATYTVVQNWTPLRTAPVVKADTLVSQKLECIEINGIAQALADVPKDILDPQEDYRRNLPMLIEIKND